MMYLIYQCRDMKNTWKGLEVGLKFSLIWFSNIKTKKQIHFHEELFFYDNC